MNPTSEILERINRSSNDHSDGVFTRLYRYLLREDIYYAAYQRLYANAGAMTQGADRDTADGFGQVYIASLINELKSFTYQPKPVRRVYIPKPNGKQRPLGIPSFRDKLLQEAVRCILEAIYEPLFSDCSHGFRPERSCHTALMQIKHKFRSVKWFIEGDIKGCFDNINHQKLIEILQIKIKDSKFINVIRLFLKAGYIEDFDYNTTLSGTPQGGVISPILANIYLHELDKKVMELKQAFDRPAHRYQSAEYVSISKRRQTLQKKIARATAEEKPAILQEYKAVCKQKKSTPARLSEDKKLVYCRYADDFLIGVSGNREDCERIKTELKDFLMDGYSLELSDEKTKITHSAEPVRFLGYDVAVRRSQQLKRRSDGTVTRTLNNSVALTIPLEDKIMKFLFAHEVIQQRQDGQVWHVAIPRLRHKSELDIVRQYDWRIRGICNYYRLAANYNKLHYFRYLMEYSCLKTLASKSGSTTAKILRKYKTSDGWGIPYQTATGTHIAQLAKLADCKKGKFMIDRDPWKYKSYSERGLTLRQRLERCKCELCGESSARCSIHHAGSMKNCKDDTEWGRKMLGMRRKTLVVCESCHAKIHGT